MPSDGASARTTVVLADDHAVVRSGVRMLLGTDDAFAVLEETTSVTGTREAVARLRPDLLLLDVSLADGDSLAALPAIVASSPRTRVLVLTMHDEPRIAVKALTSGASGFVRKDAPEAELLLAVRSVAAGGRHLDARLGAELAAAATPVDDGLTPRQREVLALVARGHTNHQIGTRLHLSERTVESVRRQVRERCGVQTQAELVRLAGSLGLVPADEGPRTAR